MATFQTTDYAQMRRCRMAHLHGDAVTEMFESGSAGLVGSGFIHAIRPDLTCWPLRWTITIEHEDMVRPVRQRVRPQKAAMALQD